MRHALSLLLVMLCVTPAAAQTPPSPSLTGTWVAQVSVWNNAASREQSLTRVLLLQEDGTYLTTIRVADRDGSVSKFPTTAGTYAWVTIHGVEEFCVTPDVAGQRFPHCYPLTVTGDELQWGEVVFRRVNDEAGAPILAGTDEYPDPEPAPMAPPRSSNTTQES